MCTSEQKTRRPIIGVLGGGAGFVERDDAVYGLATELGGLIAEAGAILLCGGGLGVMEAAARGARDAGGHTLGVMPSTDRAHGAPNDYIDCAIYTGLREGRNYLTAAIPDAAIALAGEAGTLSEIGLAMKLGTPLVYLAAWNFLNGNGLPTVKWVAKPAEALECALKAINVAPGGRLNLALKVPSVPVQQENMEELERTVAQWSITP